MCISGIYALTLTTDTTVDNKMRTGGVNIKLEEFILNEGNQEVEYTDTVRTVVPGEKINLIPRITNLAAPCYVRVKLGYNSGSNIATFSDSSYGEMGDNWKKAGDYWYYKTPLAQDAKLDVFKYVIIPTNMGNDDQDKELKLNILAEAIQSDNFTPNFESDEPWGNPEILANSDTEYRMSKAQIADDVKIVYEGDSSNYIEIPEDFMLGLSELMPGDSNSYNIKVKPTADANTSFAVEVTPSNVDDAKTKALLQKLILEIKNGDTVIYNGNLDLSEPVPFASFTDVATQDIKFTVKMSEGLNNEYAMLNAPITWKFTTKVTSEEPPVIDYSNSYGLEIVKVRDDGKTVITSDEATLIVNDEEKKTTNGVYSISKIDVKKENQTDTFVIKEKTAPEGFEKYTGTIELKVGYKVDTTINKLVVDPSKTTFTAPGLSADAYKIAADNQKITIYLLNKEIIPEPPVEPTGKYTIELVKVQEDGTTAITTDEATFTINDNNVKTQKGVLSIAADKEITSVTQKDTYVIKEKLAPEGYSRYTGTIKLDVAFKLDEKENTYVIDESKTKIDAPGLTGGIYKVSGNNYKLTVYVPNTKIPPKPAPVPSPQTGDVKIKIAIGVFVIAAIILVIIFVLERKNKSKEK